MANPISSSKYNLVTTRYIYFMCKRDAELEVGNPFHAFPGVFFSEWEDNQETVDQCVQELFSEGHILIFRKHSAVIM